MVLSPPCPYCHGKRVNPSAKPHRGRPALDQQWENSGNEQFVVNKIQGMASVTQLLAKAKSFFSDPKALPGLQT